MYSAVLMLAMTTGAEAADHGRRSCHGCNGCYSAPVYYSSCSGCHGRAPVYYSTCCGGTYRAGYYSSNYYQPQVYSSGYYYPSMAVLPTTESRQSFYFDPSQPPTTTMRILVPNTEAEIW